MRSKQLTSVYVATYYMRKKIGVSIEYHGLQRAG